MSATVLRELLVPQVGFGGQGLEQRGPATEAVLPEVTPPAAGHWQNLAALVPIG
jgi:hypothetical protein